MQNITAEIKREQIGAFREYLNQRENADATIKKYITDISTFLRYLNNESTIDKQKLLDYKEWLLRRYAVSSVNSMLAALNQFLEFLNLSFLKVKRVKVQNNLFLKDEKELTKDEYRRLVKTAAEEGREQLALCIETIASTGIRISELEFFTVESVRRDYIEIVNKGKYRRIFLPKVLRQKLILFARKHGVQKGAIFVTRNGKPKNRSNIWREMKALEEKAGISGNKFVCTHLLQRNKGSGRAGRSSWAQQSECNKDIYLKYGENLSETAGFTCRSEGQTNNIMSVMFQNFSTHHTVIYKY